MTDGAISTERRDDIALVRLNRPDAFNAINHDLARELFSNIEKIGTDDEVRGLVLTGAGRAFCAGGDLETIWTHSERDPESGIYELAGEFHDAILQLRRLPKIVVAAINGPAVGGGFSLALACDLRVISAEAYFRVGYTSNGISMDGGGSQLLPRIVGLGRASELVALDEEVGAERALDIGLANDVAPAGEALDRALEIADRVADKSRGAFSRTKRLMNRAFDHSIERHLEAERRHIAKAAASPEGREGIRAFLENREADFRNL